LIEERRMLSPRFLLLTAVMSSREETPSLLKRELTKSSKISLFELFCWSRKALAFEWRRVLMS